MGITQSQSPGFGYRLSFCPGQHKLRQNNETKGYQLSDAVAHKVSGKYRGVAKLEEKCKAKVLRMCSQHSLMRIIAVVPRRRGQDAEIAMVQAVRLILPKQSCGGELSRKSAEDAKASAIQGCQQAQHIAL